MRQFETELLKTLADLDTTVRSLKSPEPRKDLSQLLDRIDQLTAQLPKDVDPQLAHFLHRKSYEKAKQWLEAQP